MFFINIVIFGFKIINFIDNIYNGIVMNEILSCMCLCVRNYFYVGWYLILYIEGYVIDFFVVC